MSEQHDAATVLRDELDLARRATAYYLRCLAQTDDDALRRESRLEGWTGAELVADVAYQARALAETIEGERPVAYESWEAAAERTLFDATLSATALRHLAHHTCVHLNVVWRDHFGSVSGPDAIQLAPGQLIGPAESVRLRTETLWLRSLDLSSFASFRDAPAVIPLRIIASQQEWIRTADIRLVFVERGDAAPGSETGSVVSGTTAGIGRWAAGRGDAPSGLRPPRRGADRPPAEVAGLPGHLNRFAGA